MTKIKDYKQQSKIFIVLDKYYTNAINIITTPLAINIIKI